MADSVFSVHAANFNDLPNQSGLISQAYDFFTTLIDKQFQSVNFESSDQQRLIGNELNLTITYADATTPSTEPFQVYGFTARTVEDLNVQIQAYLDANPSYFISAPYVRVLQGQQRTKTFVAVVFFNPDASNQPNWPAGGGISLPIPAADVSYFNTSYPSLENVQQALDLILHVNFSVSMTSTVTAADKGQSVPSTTLNWSYNKSISSQNLSGTGTTPPLLAARSQLVTGPFTTNQTWTVSAISIDADSGNASATLTFYDRAYWGPNASLGPINSAQTIALANSNRQTSFVGLYSFVPANEYLYMCFPTAWGTPVFRVSGLITTFAATGYTFTNAFGFANSYTQFKSQFTQNGSVTVAATTT